MFFKKLLTSDIDIGSSAALRMKEPVVRVNIRDLACRIHECRQCLRPEELVPQTRENLVSKYSPQLLDRYC